MQEMNTARAWRVKKPQQQTAGTTIIELSWQSTERATLHRRSPIYRNEAACRRENGKAWGTQPHSVKKIEKTIRRGAAQEAPWTYEILSTARAQRACVYLENSIRKGNRSALHDSKHTPLLVFGNGNLRSRCSAPPTPASSSPPTLPLPAATRHG